MRKAAPEEDVQMGSFTSAGVAVSNWSANSVNRILPNTADTELKLSGPA